jgi:hypothetical protein
MPAERSLGTRRLSLNDIWKASENRSQNQATFIDNLAEWGHHMTENHSTFQLPDNARWHLKLLNLGYLIVRNQASLVHMQYWAVCFPNTYNMAQLLNLAITWGIQFTIGVRLEDLHCFCPWSISTIERNMVKQPHEARMVESRLEYSLGGSTLRDSYIACMGEILKRPNAGALIGLGGPASWIARQYGGDDIVQAFMQGPSLIVTWHNKGTNGSRDRNAKGLHWDEVTPQELGALFGHVSMGGPGEDQWFFPTEEILLEHSKHYSGEWNKAAESLFKQINDKINGEFPHARTKGEWQEYV